MTRLHEACVSLIKSTNLVRNSGPGARGGSTSSHVMSCYPESPSHTGYLKSLVSLTSSLIEQLKEQE